jgi:uncharacterized phage infection (PIP) family protein YhgE
MHAPSISINVPKFVMPDVVSELLNKIENKIISTVVSEYKIVKEKLSDLQGTIDDVGKRERKIVKEFKTILENNEEIQPILEKLQKLSDEIR